MPFAFSGQRGSFVAKLGVVSDGDTFTVGATQLDAGSAATLTLSGSTVTLTGGSGFTSGMTGQFITISGAATSGNNGTFALTYISATSVSWTNASGATDANNGSISWFVSATGKGTLVTGGLSSHTVFAAAPVWSATGVWSVTLKDIAAHVCTVVIAPVLPSGTYLSVQQLPDVVGSTGLLTLSWVFNSAGTPTDLPQGAQMRVYIVYSETKV